MLLTQLRLQNPLDSTPGFLDGPRPAIGACLQVQIISILQRSSNNGAAEHL